MSSNNAPELIRSLVVYAICIPLAIILGYSLTDITYGTIGMVGVLGAFLVLPLLLKYHYPLLLFSWHASIWLFFVKASPNLWVAAVALSLGITVMEKVIARETSYISVPSVVWPILAMLALVFITAKMNGGMGLRSAGSAVYGGKKYILLILGLLSYFALVSKPIPPEKANRYAALFILGGLTAAVGDMAYFTPRWMTPVFWVFPPSGGAVGDIFEAGTTRLAGVGAFGVTLFTWLIARYGLRGIFLSGKVWRVALLLLMFFAGTLGGFRTSLFLMIAVFAAAFFAEKIYQTWLMAPAVLGALCLGLIIIPTARHLPFTAQRAMAFLPLDLDPEAVAAAQSSTDWRFDMWSGLMDHEVPDHLWLGKGYAISKDDFDEMMTKTAFSSASGLHADQQGLALAGDYHNGVLSLVIPLGVYGVVIFLWFGGAGLRVVYLNYKYGRPEIRTLNFFMFFMFLMEFVAYLSCVGGLGFTSDINWFAGYLGMSVALNGGVCNKHSPGIREEAQRVVEVPTIEQPQLLPAARA